MAEDSNIEWTTHTFNPWRGCSKVSPGCAHCYAETMSGRNPKTLGVWGPNGTRVVAAEAQWKLPLKWDRDAEAAGERHRVFCASLADVFEDWHGPMVGANGNPLWWCHGSLSNSPIPSIGLESGCRMATMSDIRDRLFQLIDDTPNLDWLLLTKRPENIARMMPWARRGETRMEPASRKNIWLGTSIENQEAADERIPRLLKNSAAVRFLSVEPLLGPICFEDVPVGMFGPLRPHGGTSEVTPRIDWVIVGGESGPGARPCRVEWIRDLVQQCKAAGVPVFVKQLGANVLAGNPCDPIDQFPNDAVPRFSQGPDQSTAMIHLIDRKGGDMGEWPEDLRVREFPTTQRTA